MPASIVIPTYNCEDYIEVNLTRLICLIPKNAEIIIVDDGSTDDTIKIIKRLKSSTIRKMKLIRMEHTSPAHERNIGWRESKNDIVIFLDSDCAIGGDWYEEMLDPFREKDVVAVSGVYITDQDQFISRYIQEQTAYRQGKVTKYTDNLATYSLAVKKEFLEKAGGFPEDFPHASCEDTEFSYKLRKFGKFVLNRDAIVVHKHSESVMEYLKKQFTHAKYRIFMYKRGNPVKDNYTDWKILIQPFIALVSLFFFSFYDAFMVFFGSLFAMQVDEICNIEDFKFYVFSTFIGIVRAYVWLAGMMWWFIEFYV